LAAVAIQWALPNPVIFRSTAGLLRLRLAMTQNLPVLVPCDDRHREVALAAVAIQWALPNPVILRSTAGLLRLRLAMTQNLPVLVPCEGLK